MYSKILLLTSLIVSSVVLSGCAGQKRAEMAPSEKNILGIVKTEEASYEQVKPNTILFETDELFARKNYSGRKTELFWGLITIKDY